MPDENSIDAQKSKRWVKILLVLSLALNLLVVGVVVGVISEHRIGDSGQRSRLVLRDNGLGPYVRALSREDRKALGAIMRKELGTDRENIPKLRQNYHALLQALRANTYDDVKIRQLVEEQQTFITKRQQLGLSLMLERFGTMTPRERKQFARRLERALSKSGSGG